MALAEDKSGELFNSSEAVRRPRKERRRPRYEWRAEERRRDSGTLLCLICILQSRHEGALLFCPTVARWDFIENQPGRRRRKRVSESRRAAQKKNTVRKPMSFCSAVAEQKWRVTLTGFCLLCSRVVPSQVPYRHERSHSKRETAQKRPHSKKQQLRPTNEPEIQPLQALPKASL